jgi:hypothetical protein
VKVPCLHGFLLNVCTSQSHRHKVFSVTSYCFIFIFRVYVWFLLKCTIIYVSIVVYLCFSCQSHICFIFLLMI